MISIISKWRMSRISQIISLFVDHVKCKLSENSHENTIKFVNEKVLALRPEGRGTLTDY